MTKPSPPPHQVRVEKWPDIKSYSRLLLAKVREGRARNPTEKLKETVTCGLDEKQSLFGRGLSPGDRNELGCLPFLSILLVGRGNSSRTFGHRKKKKGSGSRKVTDPEPQTSHLHAGRGRLCCQEASWLNIHQGVSQRHPPCLGPHSHAFGETVTLHLALPPLWTIAPLPAPS